MKLSVIIPAYNEEKTIGKVLEGLKQVKEVYEIVVVDDCSTDKTGEVVKKSDNPLVKLVRHEKNLGKGKAIQTGLSHVTGNYVLIQDADLEYDPQDIPVLLEPIKRERCEVVYGSRFFGARTSMFYWHYLGNKFLNWVVNILFNSILSDMETGYKLIPTKLFKQLNLKSNDFCIEPEITCKLLKRGVKIVEVPISYVARTYEEGKKITWIDGFSALATILKIKFGSY